jgi:hypothetical protein
MSKGGFKFELNRKGVRELLTSPEMAEVIREASQQVANNAGDGYESNVQTANRAVGRVFAATDKAYKDNNENNTLLKALHD